MHDDIRRDTPDMIALRVVRVVRRVVYRLTAVLLRSTRSHLAKRKRFQELRALSAMSNVELKDIGISRLEIRAAMGSTTKTLSRSGSCWPATKPDSTRAAEIDAVPTPAVHKCCSDS